MGADQPFETGKNKNKLQILWALIYWARSICALYLAIASIYLHVGSVADLDPFPILSSDSGAVLAWPLAAEAQQQAVRVIGFLHMELFDLFADRLRAFRQGLSQTGHVESRSRVKLA